MFVAAARYPFDRAELKGVDQPIPEGLRGSGSQAYASRIWGISGTEYMERADPWPMNPKGELILPIKMEDKHALEAPPWSSRTKTGLYETADAVIARFIRRVSMREFGVDTPIGKAIQFDGYSAVLPDRFATPAIRGEKPGFAPRPHRADARVPRT
jgi:hypothetical protein